MKGGNQKKKKKTKTQTCEADANVRTVENRVTGFSPMRKEKKSILQVY